MDPAVNTVCSDLGVIDITATGQQADIISGPNATVITVTNYADIAVVDAAQDDRFTMTTDALSLFINIPLAATKVTLTANLAHTFTLLAQAATKVTFTANDLTTLNFISPADCNVITTGPAGANFTIMAPLSSTVAVTR